MKRKKKIDKTYIYIMSRKHIVYTYIDIWKAATIQNIWSDCEWNVRNENNFIYVNWWQLDDDCQKPLHLIYVFVCVSVCVHMISCLTWFNFWIQQTFHFIQLECTLIRVLNIYKHSIYILYVACVGIKIKSMAEKTNISGLRGWKANKSTHALIHKWEPVW